jgi:hypothetical protein
MDTKGSLMTQNRGGNDNDSCCGGRHLDRDVEEMNREWRSETIEPCIS